MNDEIVYFACNNWYPEPKDAERLIYDNLENENDKDFDERNKLCINVDVVDMSFSYYITAKRSFFKEQFPELLKFVKTEPYDFLWDNDKQFFLEYKEENIGYSYAEYKKE